MTARLHRDVRGSQAPEGRAFPRAVSPARGGRERRSGKRDRSRRPGISPRRNGIGRRRVANLRDPRIRGEAPPHPPLTAPPLTGPPTDRPPDRPPPAPAQPGEARRPDRTVAPTVWHRRNPRAMLLDSVDSPPLAPPPAPRGTWLFPWEPPACTTRDASARSSEFECSVFVRG